MFAKFPNAVADYGEDIEIPKLIQDNQVDYEGELVVVIGQSCKDVKREDAMKYVLGYTVANDLSARFGLRSVPYPSKGQSLMKETGSGKGTPNSWAQGRHHR